MNISYILGESRLTVSIPGRSPVTVPTSDEKRVKSIMDLIKKEDVKLLEEELFPAKKIQTITNGEIKFDGNHVYWIGEKDIPMPRVLGERILDFDAKDYPIQALIHFWKKLLQNPSATAREQLYGFIEHNDMAITDDGYILAYKKVTSKNGKPIPEKMYGWYVDGSNLVRYSSGQVASEDDRKSFADYIASAIVQLVDSHSGTFDNSIGATPTMDRTDVDADRNVTCSTGLDIRDLSLSN